MAPMLQVIQSVRFTGGVAGPPSVPQGVDDTTALDLDGASEMLSHNTNAAVGIANVWTMMQWLKFDTLDTEDYTTFQIWNNTPDNANRITFRYLNGIDEFRFNLRDSGGTSIKNYTTDFSSISNDEWVMILITWDGTNLKIYLNGTEDTSPTKNTDISGTMTDSDRAIHIGNHNVDDFTAALLGRMHSAAIWSVVLGSDIVTDLYNSGAGGVVDLREVQGAYTQTEVDALEHYYRHATESGNNIGQDFGNGTGRDVGDDAANLGASDKQTDSPI